MNLRYLDEGRLEEILQSLSASFYYSQLLKRNRVVTFVAASFVVKDPSEY